MSSFQTHTICDLLPVNRPELTCVLNIGRHDSITFSGHRELLITRFLEEGHQLQVVAFPIIENIDPRGSVNDKSTSQVIWQTRNDDHEGSSKIALTSALPLELDLIIQGYCGLSRIYTVFITYRSRSFQLTVVFVNFRWLRLRQSLIFQPC
jgi:hypothetical protein